MQKIPQSKKDIMDPKGAVPSNNQSMSTPNPDDEPPVMDFLLTNEPSQFNCFMNSII